MKILHLPTDVGGNSWGLSKGERELGLESSVLTEQSSLFQYPADTQLNLDKNRLFITRFMKKIHYFLKIRSNYDVFHFNFGKSLLHYPQIPFLAHFELPFYPKKSKLFVTYNGCDARQKYPTMCRRSIAACHEKGCYGGMCNSGKKDEQRRIGINKMTRYVKHIWALNPDLLHFLPQSKSSFLPYSIASYDKLLKNTRAYSPKKVIKILHAPSDQSAKGTSYVISALEKIKCKYPNYVELILVQNVPHDQAIELYQTADLIIDQLLIGWYGAFAVEAMLLGKPVIVRIEEADLKLIPKQMALDLMQTIIQANPMTIYDVLEEIIENRLILSEKASASIEYANKWHNPKYVASIAKEKYESF